MSKKLNVLISFVYTDNASELTDGGGTYGWFQSAFNGYYETDAQDIIIDNPDGCYNMAVAAYHNMLDEYTDYEEVLFRAFITSQIHVGDDETYIIVRKTRNTFLVEYYLECDAVDDEDIDEDDIIYINDKPYVDLESREAYWFTNVKFTDRDATESEDVECKIREAFEKYDKEYFEEY